MQSLAQKKARENFKKAIEYRKKTGCSLKEAFAHISGKKTVTKKVGTVKKDLTAYDVLKYREKVGEKKFRALTPAQRVKGAQKNKVLLSPLKKKKKVAGYVTTIRKGSKTNVLYTKQSKLSGTKNKKVPSEFISLSGYEPTKEIVLGSIGKLKTIENLIPEVKVRITRGKSAINEIIKQSSDSEKIFKKFIGRDKIQTQEFFAVMYLAQSNKVLGVYVHSMGSINATSADIRLILAGALRIGAVAIIICHNHPSGNLTPSAADLSLTKKIKEAATYHDIRLVDHVIITKDGYYSFIDNGQL